MAGDHEAFPFPCHSRASIGKTNRKNFIKMKPRLGTNSFKKSHRDGRLYICKNNLTDLTNKKNIERINIETEDEGKKEVQTEEAGATRK